MQEGYWINYVTGKTFVIDEHERWLRDPRNAAKIGLPKMVMEALSKFKPVKDREKMLLFVLQHSPLMRVRGHGNFITFEYSSSSRSDPMDAIWTWGKKNAGEYTGMYIVNFATGEKVNIFWKDFERAADEGGYDAVMRAAKTFRLKVRVASELLEMSRKLIGERYCLKGPG
jgi:hypothetical protein